MNPVDPRASDDFPPAVGTTFYGARWAVGLAAALLLSLAVLTAMRWFGPAAASSEQIVQIPVAAVTPTPTPPSEVLAPDPGDTP